MSSATLPTPALHHWSPARSAAGHHNPWTIAWILSIATFMEVLDTSVANVSLQHIAGSLSAGTDESTWVITSYLVANAIILPVSGWLSNIIGRKRFYMMCVTLFTISSLLCGMSTSLGQLIFFRVLQGLGGGGLVPSEQAMLADTFPPEKRGQAFALYGIAVVVAPTLGPTLGGWITDSFSWHWIFLINVPVGLISLFLCGKFINEPPLIKQERKELLHKGLKIDYIGFALIAIGLGALEVTLSNGERKDWFESPFVRTFAILSAVSLIAAFFWEWNAADPVLDVKLLRKRNFGLCMVMIFIVGFNLYSSTTLLPILVQGVHGYTSLLAGWVLTPGGLATLMCMPIVGMLTSKVQLRFLLGFGLIVLSFATYRMSYFTPDLTFGQAMWARIFQSLSLGFLFIPITTLSYMGLPPGKNNIGSSMISVFRNIGGSVGIALTNTLLANRMQFHHANLVANINPYNPMAREMIQKMQGYLDSMGAPMPDAQSLAAFQGMINRQAMIMSFNDVCWMLGILVACVVVLVPFLSKAKAEAGAAGH